MKMLKGVLVTLVLLAVSQSSVVGQDYDALLNAVQKMEANLRKLVEQEATARTAQVTELSDSFKQLHKTNVPTGGQSGADWSQQIAELTTAIIELRADLIDLQNRADGDDLSQELAILRGEIAALQEAMHENRPALASTDPDSYAMAMRPPSTEVSEELAETESTFGGIEWSGFFDVVGSVQGSAEDETQFGLGQAEIDLASQLSDRVAVEAAVAYNNETGNFELGAAIVDIHLFSREEGERHTQPSFSIDHSYILAGQFDVPFGIDYHVYPSIERKLVTGPLAVDLTHGGWNDFGVQLGLETPYANFVCYWVNGFESSLEILDEAQTLATGEEVYEEINTTPADAFGTQLGITPLTWLEIGSSFAAGWNASGKDEMTLVGADVQMSLSNLEIKGEYISHSLNRTIAEENNRGWYAQATYSLFSNAFVTTRYGSFKPEQQDWYGQGSVGLGYALTDGVELRWESSIHETGANNQNFLQLVAGF